MAGHFKARTGTYQGLILYLAFSSSRLIPAGRVSTSWGNHPLHGALILSTGPHCREAYFHRQPNFLGHTFDLLMRDRTKC